MKKVYFELESLDKIHEAARYFLNAVGDANIFAIDGDMGGRQDHLHQSRLRGTGRQGCHHLPHLLIGQRIYRWQG